MKTEDRARLNLIATGLEEVPELAADAPFLRSLAESQEPTPPTVVDDLRGEIEWITDNAAWESPSVATRRLEDLISKYESQEDKEPCPRCKDTRFETPGVSCAACVRVALSPPQEDQESGGVGEGWKGALNQALEVAQTEGVPLSALLDYARGGEGKADRHRVTITFDDFGDPRVELLHPDRGGLASMGLGCQMEDGECVYASWVEERGVELLRGALTVPVRITWSDGATPELNIQAATPQPHQQADQDSVDAFVERLLSEEFARSVYWAVPASSSLGMTMWEVKAAIRDAAQAHGLYGLAAVATARKTKGEDR